MSDDERDQFLAEPALLMRIGTVRADGSPLVAPIWYLYQDGAIWFTPREKSEWLANLRRDPRVCLDIDEQALPYRKVIVEGRAELVHDLGNDDRWRELYRRIARRYGPEEMVEQYIQETIDQPRALMRVRLEGAEVKTWRMPHAGEPYEGMWHRRYFRPASKLGRRFGADS
jgi:PPOX class probable F420-dependent enzyme